jgi:hypothetical protein
LNIEVGSGAARSRIQPKNGRVPHLDGDEQHLVEREEDRDLDQDRPAARDRIDLLALVERHHLLLLLHPVVFEPVPDRTISG